MIFMIVQDILDSKQKIRILAWLVDRSTASFSVSELSRACDVPKATVSIIINDWDRAGLVLIRHEGRNKMAGLNKRFYLLPEIKKIFVKSKDFHRPLIKRLENMPVLNKRGVLAVMIFGSRAKGGFTSKSDLDILVVVEDKESKVAEEAFEEIIKLSEESGITHSPTVMDKHDVIERVKEKDHFIKNILSEGKILKGRKWIERLQAAS